MWLPRFLALLAFVGAMAFTGSEAVARIVSKPDWNGREATEDMTPLAAPIPRVIVAHTASTPCSDQDTCSQQMRIMQNFHQTKLHYADIAYNFVIGGDGQVYEGRGWRHAGAFARGYNADSLGVAFMGNFETSLPTPAALAAFNDLVDVALLEGKLAIEYKLLGHRQVSQTSSPGNTLYSAVREWPHWSSQA